MNNIQVNNSGARDRQWRQAFLLLLLAVTAWRLLYLIITPLDLVPDEAYYWDWGRHLAWGYYSKPPLIAWLNALSSFVFGVSPFTVRLPAVICGSVSLWALYALSARMFNPRTGFWAVLLAVAAPGSAVLNLIMTIDAPLVVCWSLALYGLWRCLEGEEGRWFWPLFTIIFCGIGLLAKQMMIFFPLLTLIFLWASREDRFHLRRPWPYLLLLLPLLFLVPDLFWNYHHGWITLKHTAHHFQGNHSFWRFETTLPDFIGSQLLLISPLTVIFMGLITFGLFRQGRKIERRPKLLIIFSVLPLLVFVLLSLRQRVNANWPAVFYLSAFILVAAWLTGHGSLRPDLPAVSRRRRLWVVLSGLFLTTLIYFLSFYIGHTAIGGGPRDPLHRLKGWSALGHEVTVLRNKNSSHGKPFILAVTRQTASELAFYVQGRPTVYIWNSAPGVISSQYDIWPGPVGKIGSDALIIIETELGGALPGELRQVFQQVRPLSPVSVPMGAAASRNYKVYLGHNLLRWPG